MQFVENIFKWFKHSSDIPFEYGMDPFNVCVVVESHWIPMRQSPTMHSLSWKCDYLNDANFEMNLFNFISHWITFMPTQRMQCIHSVPQSSLIISFSQFPMLCILYVCENAPFNLWWWWWLLLHIRYVENVEMQTKKLLVSKQIRNRFYWKCASLLCW